VQVTNLASAKPIFSPSVFGGGIKEKKMIKEPRKLVVRWEMRKPHPTWNETPHAVLECGHVLNVGNTDYRPKRIACGLCGTEKRRAEKQLLNPILQNEFIRG
jgi:hypothetical protein